MKGPGYEQRDHLVVAIATISGQNGVSRYIVNALQAHPQMGLEIGLFVS